MASAAILGGDEDMASILMDVLKPEIDEKIDNTTRTNLYIYVQDGDMKIENAARRAGLTVDQFQTQMNEYINSHKDTQLV